MFLLLKIIGAVLIIFAGFSAGSCFSHNLFARRDFLKKLMVFLSNLSTNIRYNSADIFSISTLSAQTSDIEYFKFEETEFNTPFSKQWEEKIKSLPNSLSLIKTDKEFLKEFGSELGKTDVEGQLKHIELYKSIFEKQLDDAERDIKQKSKLYRTMGLFAGTTIALMII